VAGDQPAKLMHRSGPMFVIRERLSGTILFMGKVVKPT